MNTASFSRALAAAIGLTMSSTALAAWHFDAEYGTGFVGKGDVQFVFAWNNPMLQQNANSVQFRMLSVTDTVTTWVCGKDAGEQRQERTRQTRTTLHGLVESVARDRNQVTGFHLLGYDGEPSSSNVTEGPAIGTCPTFWSIDAGSIETFGPYLVGGGVQVSVNGADWHDLPESAAP
jgi:hypothetical protein